jgi:hypothetical protein
MPYRLEAFSGVRLTEALLRLAIGEHAAACSRLSTFWTYYRNPFEPVGGGGVGSWAGRGGAPCGRGYRLAQECGLPGRIVGPRDVLADDRYRVRREVVVENDIAWRIHAMVDFMFGKPVLIVSTARDEGKRSEIQRILDAVWEASGGIALLQDMALLGHVYGHVDLLLRANSAAAGSGNGNPTVREGRSATAPDTAGVSDALLGAATDALRIEVIEPLRGIPVLSPADYRALDAYILHFQRPTNEIDQPGAIRRLVDRATGNADVQRRKIAGVTEIFSTDHRQLYQDERLVEESGSVTPGALPVVHIQNTSQPFRYEGQGEVEGLIPLQDELNTRLSDRASRVTLQSFKMYLAKGIDGFEKVTVAPGQIWSTDNMDASVEAFGGDADSPSETAHIQEIREALDKISGVPPLASGVVRAKIGNLTSANALKITLMGVLSRTARKRVTYGRGIAQMCRLILHALDAAGLYASDEQDRGVRLEWPDPLPIDVREQVAAAKVKADLGVPAGRVLSELGYAADDPGVT